MGGIKDLCLSEKSRNPHVIVKKIMKLPDIPIHGPIHHFIDGAAFLTALHNAGMEFDLMEALTELEERSKLMPGATCGKWGVCNSASSLGAALAIIHSTGPLSDNDFYKDNLELTSRILSRIAELGGPRCCKRNGFTALLIGAIFVKEKYGIELEVEDITCEFSPLNQQCIGTRCPYFKKTTES
ncbi:MAG TPA: hypothetical protein DCX39_04085 [Firmicutes bacterium]|nr:hypothetical protein [Bacillota bacterium]HAX00316.1 hypothetical protein [Bacillota bacterium]